MQLKSLICAFVSGANATCAVCIAPMVHPPIAASGLFIATATIAIVSGLMAYNYAKISN